MGRLRGKRLAWVRALTALFFLLSGVLSPAHIHAAPVDEDGPQIICTEHGPIIVDNLAGTAKSPFGLDDAGHPCCSISGCCGFVLELRPAVPGMPIERPAEQFEPGHANNIVPKRRQYAFRTRDPPALSTPTPIARRALL